MLFQCLICGIVYFLPLRYSFSYLFLLDIFALDLGLRLYHLVYSKICHVHSHCHFLMPHISFPVSFPNHKISLVLSFIVPYVVCLSVAGHFGKLAASITIKKKKSIFMHHHYYQVPGHYVSPECPILHAGQ